MFRRAHRQAVYMHADRFDVTEKSLQSAPVPYMHQSRTNVEIAAAKVNDIRLVTERTQELLDRGDIQ